MTETMLKSSRLPQKFQAEAITTAVYVRIKYAATKLAIGKSLDVWRMFDYQNRKGGNQMTKRSIAYSQGILVKHVDTGYDFYGNKLSSRPNTLDSQKTSQVTNGYTRIIITVIDTIKYGKKKKMNQKRHQKQMRTWLYTNKEFGCGSEYEGHGNNGSTRSKSTEKKGKIQKSE